MDIPDTLRKALDQREIATWISFISKPGVKKIGEIVRNGMTSSQPRENIIDAIRGILEKERSPSVSSEYQSVPTNRLAAFITEQEIGFLYAMAQHFLRQEVCKLSPDLSRIWVQKGNTKEPNDGHVVMHGQLVSAEQPFRNPFTGRSIMYPRDPEADMSETINCSCEVVLYQPLYGSLETFIGKPTGRNVNAKSSLDYDPVPPKPTKEQIVQYRNKVVNILRQEPGLTQVNLYKRFKIEEKERVGYAISALKEVKEIRREKRGPTFALWLNETPPKPVKNEDHEARQI